MFERPSHCAAGAALIWMLSAGAAAGVAGTEGNSGSSYVTDAEVISVTPRYGWREVEEPARYCDDVPAGRRSYDRRDRYGRIADPRRRWDGDGGEAAAGLVGGLIGGLVGHQFGGGNGKKAITIVGAALGASIAQDHARRSHAGGAYRDRYESGYHGRGVTRYCRETVETRRVRGVQGYDVAYRYQGRTFNKWMDEHPGDRVRIHVEVAPEDGLARR